MAEIYMAAAAKPVETHIDQASAYIRTGDISNPEVYSKTCLNLGRTIDSAIAMNAVPSSSHLLQLLLIVEEVYKRKNELLQPSLISFMLPIKVACQIGWFRDKDKDRLLIMAKEVSSGFSNLDKINIEPSDAHSYVSNIISRFYPKMKVEHILTSLDAKAGYGSFVADFHISLGMLPSECQNLWLLVARMDNMDTAACIASPSNVDFLINRIEVPQRTRNNMGTGPQLPSNVTKMTKYGVNLLEVSGDFDGPYIIAVACMNLITSPDPPQLQDYEPPMSDCEIIEMSSQISLNCPISRRRIKTPVKGHLCNHTQCFDYNYFMEINSVRPTWKCPVCNSSVCNLDIRIDQNFLKILNEVADDVSDVIISIDGSWVVVTTEKSRSTETNRDTMNQNDHVPDTIRNHIPIEAKDVLPNPSVVHELGGSAVGMILERPSTSCLSTVTPPVVSPQRSCNMVHTPSPVQQTRQHLNTDKLTTQTSAQIQPQQVQSQNLSTPVELLPSASKPPQSTEQTSEQLRRGNNERDYTPGQSHANFGTTRKAPSRTLFTSVQLRPAATRSPDSADKQMRRSEQHTTAGLSQANIGTTAQARSKNIFTPIELPPSATKSHQASKRSRTRGKQQCYKAPGRPQFPVTNGDATPSGTMRGSLTTMRGSLKGDQLEAARLELLSRPLQPF